MTKHSRAVLLDCEGAFAELQSVQQELLRRRWITVLALLRAVGHVLDKVDGETDKVSRNVIRQSYERLKSTKPKIYWDFIEEERNNILKEYRFAVQGDLTIVMSPPGGYAVGPTGSQYFLPRFDLVLKSGPFKGQDPISVVQEAIQFWREHLDDIDREIVQAKQP